VLTALLSLFAFLTVASADPSQVIVQKFDDGAIGRCADAQDIGNWAYLPVQWIATETTEGVQVGLTVYNMECGTNVKWAPRSPYSPIIKDNKTTNLLELYAVLIDRESAGQTQLVVANQILQTYNWDWPIENLGKKLARLKNGQSFTKRFFFQIRSKMETDGFVRVASGGAYSVDVIWRKEHNVIRLTSIVR